MTKKLLLFPCNGNSREALLVVDAINAAANADGKEDEWQVIGFIDDNPDLKGTFVAGVPVLGGISELGTFPDAQLLAVPGRPDNFHRRHQLLEKLSDDSTRFATLIHPSVSIGREVTIGYNTLLMPGVVLTANVAVGNHCLIMSHSVVSHDTRIGNYSLIGSHVAIAGGVTIEKGVYIGTGSRIIHEITIGEHTLVGMGSVVIRATLPRTVVAGVPARMIREVR